MIFGVQHYINAMQAQVLPRHIHVAPLHFSGYTPPADKAAIRPNIGASVRFLGFVHGLVCIPAAECRNVVGEVPADAALAFLGNPGMFNVVEAKMAPMCPACDEFGWPLCMEASANSPNATVWT
jgi:hypothetical protein